jgi:hypothetical protein
MINSDIKYHDIKNNPIYKNPRLTRLFQELLQLSCLKTGQSPSVGGKANPIDRHRNLPLGFIKVDGFWQGMGLVWIF